MKRDSEVEQQVLKSLRLDSAISSREICLHSHCGVVTLSGTVPSYLEWSAIYHASLRSLGVCWVVNRIEVRGDRHRTLEPSLSDTRLSDTRSSQPADAPASSHPTHYNSRVVRITGGKSTASGAKRSTRVSHLP
jgi:osmotically-inducible protein OsmY